MKRNLPSTTQRRVSQRRFGLSLLELLAVVTLMSIFAAAAMTRFGRDIFGDSGVRSGARLLSLGILEAQRSAIRTGDSHGVQFSGTESVSAWSVFHIGQDGKRTIIDGPHEIPTDYRLQVSSSEVQFDFEGNGIEAFEADFQGPNRRWNVAVFPLTRTVQSREVTP